MSCSHNEGGYLPGPAQAAGPLISAAHDVSGLLRYAAHLEVYGRIAEGPIGSRPDFHCHSAGFENQHTAEARLLSSPNRNGLPFLA